MENEKIVVANGGGVPISHALRDIMMTEALIMSNLGNAGRSYYDFLGDIFPSRKSEDKHKTGSKCESRIEPIRNCPDCGTKLVRGKKDKHNGYERSWKCPKCEQTYSYNINKTQEEEKCITPKL